MEQTVAEEREREKQKKTTTMSEQNVTKHESQCTQKRLKRWALYLLAGKQTMRKSTEVLRKKQTNNDNQTTSKTTQNSTFDTKSNNVEHGFSAVSRKGLLLLLKAKVLRSS